MVHKVLVSLSIWSAGCGFEYEATVHFNADVGIVTRDGIEVSSPQIVEKHFASADHGLAWEGVLLVVQKEGVEGVVLVKPVCASGTSSETDVLNISWPATAVAPQLSGGGKCEGDDTYGWDT